MHGPAYPAAIELLDTERDNLWSVLRWSLSQGRAEPALRLVTALSLYWDERAFFDEGLAALQEALAHGSDAPAPLRAAAYVSGAKLAMGTAEHELATSLAHQGLELAEQCGDQPARWRAQEMLAVVALFSFVGTLNEYVIVSTLMQTQDHQTLPVGLRQFIDKQYEEQWGVFSAGVLLAAVPAVVLFSFLQRYIVGGLTAGSVKG